LAADPKRKKGGLHNPKVGCVTVKLLALLIKNTTQNKRKNNGGSLNMI
jgi:hypothetical protein